MTSPTPPSVTGSFAGVRFAVVDIETSGLRPRRHRVLQIAVVTTDASGQVLDTWSSYVRPRWWPLVRLGPRHVHGISRSMLRNAPDAAAVMGELAARVHDTVVIAHNAGFDLAFLRRAARRTGVTLPNTQQLCTLRMSRALDPERERSHRLADLCVRYRVDPGRAHDALADARATAAVLPHLLGQLEATSLDDLAPFAA